MGDTNTPGEAMESSEFTGSFEEAVQKLESIVRRLESDATSLDDSLHLFEDGVKLSRFCSRQLDEAEKKVLILMEDREGNLSTPAFEPEKSQEGR
jgi:exodeoxyribonuclease VII small subunit